MREAEPLLPLNLSSSYFYNEPGKSFKIIGFKDTDERELKQFRELLTNNLGVSDTVIKPTQTEDEIVVVNEYAAFPLRLINGFKQMREQYNRQLQYEAALLHNDCSKGFTDIIPPDARKMEELQDIFYTCLALGLLKENLETNKYEFQYYDELRSEYYIAELSYVWNEALEQLAVFGDMTNALKQIKDETITQIKNNSHQWENNYLPKLRAFVAKVDSLTENDPNYPEKAIVVGTRATIDTPAKEGIIVRILRQIQEELERIQTQLSDKTSTKILASNLNSSNYSNGNHNVIENQGLEGDLDVEWSENSREQQSLGISLNKHKSNTQAMQRLKELVQMKKEGYLTEAEFEKAKQEILGL